MRMCMAAVVLASLPAMVQQVLRPSRRGLLYALANSAFAFFMFSYQVGRRVCEGFQGGHCRLALPASPIGQGRVTGLANPCRCCSCAGPSGCSGRSACLPGLPFGAAAASQSPAHSLPAPPTPPPHHHYHLTLPRCTRSPSCCLCCR
jgi:hypothetical protein